MDLQWQVLWNSNFFLLVFDPIQYEEYLFSVRLSYNIFLTGPRAVGQLIMNQTFKY